MKKIFTLCVGVLVAVALMGQNPTHEVQKASVSPVVDGEIDAVWDEATSNNIDKNFQSELPTLGASGDTYWKALWSEGEGIYVLLVVTDDEFYPHYIPVPAGNSWEYDKPEIYFDCNSYNLKDGLGPSGEDAGNGHYQFAPLFEADFLDGTMLDCSEHGEQDPSDAGVKYAFLVTDPNYVAEYFVPWDILVDGTGTLYDPNEQLGFDVTIIDRDQGDEARKRAVWANVGAINESWSNMDDCGILTFADVGEKVYVETITLTGGDITENNLPLQIQAEVLPADATNNSIAWSVENVTGRAKIDSKGVLTPVLDGEVIVTAAAKDGSYVEAYLTVNISNQIVSKYELNLVRNGYFDRVDDNGNALEWSGGRPVYDGVVYLDPPANGVNTWDYTMTQQTFGCNTEDQYTFSFVAWAAESDTFNVDFEDSNNGYNRYGTSTHEYSNGESDWTFVTETSPTKYVFDVVFNEKVENTNESLQFMLGKHDPEVYIDSVELINNNDLALVTEYTPVESITVTAEGGDATVAVGGTLQMNAEVLPAGATLTGVRWSVEPGTGWATIDEAGIITGDTAGTVTVIASAKDDSKVTGTLDVTVTSGVGIQQHEVNTLKVYPNPAVNELNIVLGTVNSTLTIYNSVGQKMEEVSVSGMDYRLDISGYAKGIYFVKTGNKVAKFVK